MLMKNLCRPAQQAGMGPLHKINNEKGATSINIRKPIVSQNAHDVFMVMLVMRNKP